MTKITEAEFARIVSGILEDREVIVRHNPLGPDAEVLLWMLMSCLISYLNLSEVETPCFPGKPDAATYREAVDFILKGRREGEFDASKYLDLISNVD